jgi:hypothetical protein
MMRCVALAMLLMEFAAGAQENPAAKIIATCGNGGRRHGADAARGAAATGA